MSRFIEIDDELLESARCELGMTGIADMLTAVAARTHRLTVLHYDSDFETAATVVDFQHQWVAVPGTL